MAPVRPVSSCCAAAWPCPAVPFWARAVDRASAAADWAACSAAAYWITPKTSSASRPNTMTDSARALPRSRSRPRSYASLMVFIFLHAYAVGLCDHFRRDDAQDGDGEHDEQGDPDDLVGH